MSTLTVRSPSDARVPLAFWIIVVLLALAAAGAIVVWLSLPSGGSVLTGNLSQPLDGATTAKISLNSDNGHITVDRLTGGEQLLLGGSLEYFEKQGQPEQTLSSMGGAAAFALKGGGSGKATLQMPWSACAGGQYSWLIHLNPSVANDITVYSGGGNVKLDLAGMNVTRVAADTGGGNVEVVLPENADRLSTTATTGGGNVSVRLGNRTTGSNTIKAESGAGDVAVHLPAGIAARIVATSGLGKVNLDPQFNKVSENTYQSSNYDKAANKVEITVKSGAGNVSVDTK